MIVKVSVSCSDSVKCHVFIIIFSLFNDDELKLHEAAGQHEASRFLEVLANPHFGPW